MSKKKNQATPEEWNKLTTWAGEKGLTCAVKELGKIKQRKVQERLLRYLRTNKGKKTISWLGRKRKRTQMVTDLLRVESEVIKIVNAQ